MRGRPSGIWGNTSAKRWENYPELLIGAERELLISLERRPALLPTQVWNQFHQKWQSSIFGHKGKSLQPDIISSKMRKTVLVGGKLSSCSPHYEGSERNDFVKVVKRGLDPFWWQKLKQRHDGCLMSWKWHYGDHPCLSQNLPQNISNYYINKLIF